MNVRFNDPLSLLPYQTGLLVTPLKEAAARGQSSLDSKQTAVVLGEPIPIVFCRRLSNVGGVFVSPSATEGRFSNNASTNELTVRLQLVLSEGDLPQLQIRDVFQRACRVGTWKQSYDSRTEAWLPGNVITSVAGKKFWNCPYYCGTGGTYDNITTLSYLNTHADGDETWDKQVHCFVRQGMKVTRILDDTLGPSNNVVDLALYLIRQSSRFPEAMLDLDAMESAALFTNANGFFYNGLFDQSNNLEDWLQGISRNFLLRVSDKNGKKAFKPRLPVNDNGTIKTTAISWVFTFTEDHILPDGFEIEYISLAERKPICAQMLWRQQPDDDIGIIRVMQVRFSNEAANGPFEQIDLSQFCTSENHAVKVGAYEVARRKYVTHSLRLRIKPDAFNSTLTLGDIVRVRLRRETEVDEVSLHDFLYEVERINKTISGIVELDLIHFPINASGQSILAVLVNNASGTGVLLPTGRSNFECDDPDRREDPDPLPTDPQPPPDPPDPPDGEEDLPDDEDPAPPGPDVPNPPDPVEPSPPEICGGTGGEGRPLPGDEMEVCGGSEVCEGMYNEWYLCPGSSTEINPSCTKVSQGVAVKYINANNSAGLRVFVRGRCPDPSSPDGYGPPTDSEGTPPIGGDDGDDWAPTPNPTSATRFRINGGAAAPIGSIQSQLLDFLSTTGPIIYVKRGTFTPYDNPALIYYGWVWVRYTAPNGTVENLPASATGGYIDYAGFGGLGTDPKPWGGSVTNLDTGQPWPFS